MRALVEDVRGNAREGFVARGARRRAVRRQGILMTARLGWRPVVLRRRGWPGCVRCRWCTDRFDLWEVRGGVRVTWQVRALQHARVNHPEAADACRRKDALAVVAVEAA